MKNNIILMGNIIHIYPISKTKKYKNLVISMIIENKIGNKKQKFELEFFKSQANFIHQNVKRGDLIKIKGRLCEKNLLIANKNVHKVYVKVVNFEHTKKPNNLIEFLEVK